MIEYSEKDGKLFFSVQVIPRASRSQIVGEHDASLRVRIAAPPVDGAANEELVRTLARALKVPRAAVQLVAGHTSRKKRVSVAGVTQDQLRKLLD